MQRTFHQYHLSTELAKKYSHSIYLASPIDQPECEVVLTVFAASLFPFPHDSKNFLQKAQRIKEFQHPHLAPILDIGIEDKQPFIVHELLPKGSLRKHLKMVSPDRLKLEVALSLVSQVGQALVYAHEQNIVHGNIKPENILLGANGQAVLTNFSLVKSKDAIIRDQASEEYAFCYTAPEQFAGTCDSRSDQYALGCLAYELITGHVPFASHSLASMIGSQSNVLPVPLSESVVDLPPVLETAVLKTLARDPDERFFDFSLFLEVIQSTLSPPPAFPLLHSTYSHKNRATSHPMRSKDAESVSFPIRKRAAPTSIAFPYPKPFRTSSSAEIDSAEPAATSPIPDASMSKANTTVSPIRKRAAKRAALPPLVSPSPKPSRTSSSAEIDMTEPAGAPPTPDASMPGWAGIIPPSEELASTLESFQPAFPFSQEADTSGNPENNGLLYQLLTQLEQEDHSSITMLEAMSQLELPISEPPITTAPPETNVPKVPTAESPLTTTTSETDADDSLHPDLSREEDSLSVSTPVSSVHRHSESEADETTFLSSIRGAVAYGSQSGQTVRTRHGRKRVLQLMLPLLVIVVVISSALWLSSMPTSNLKSYTTERVTQEIATPTSMTIVQQPSVKLFTRPTLQSLSPTPSPTPIPSPSVRQTPYLPYRFGERLSRSSWAVSASFPNDLPSNALDGNPATRWTTGQPQAPGDWFLVDMGSIHSFSSITLDAGSYYGDYPSEYQVFVSSDGSYWGNAIASGNGSGQVVTISFATQYARYIKVVLTANADNWWSIDEFNVNDASGALSRSGWTASASSSNMVPSNALDGNLDTRWTTGQPQAPGDWFLVDMGSIHSFSSITLDAGSYTGDYPSEYQVFVSTNGYKWGNAIASGNGSGQLVKISFATQYARYIKVVLTANADNWWSICEFNVYS